VAKLNEIPGLPSQADARAALALAPDLADLTPGLSRLYLERNLYFRDCTNRFTPTKKSPINIRALTVLTAALPATCGTGHSR
jgi:hypothetical protein